MKHILTEPFTKEKIAQFKAGDTVYITGTVYTARDAAHKELVGMLDRGEKLPFDPEGAIIYYVGPTPARPGKPIGSCGPTTSYRMDPYAPRLLDEGVVGMIGKGPRNEAVVSSAVKNGAVYLAAVGGAAALIAQSVKSAEVIAFDHLGTEACRRLTVENFPVVVAIDTAGTDLYKR